MHHRYLACSGCDGCSGCRGGSNRSRTPQNRYNPTLVLFAPRLASGIGGCRVVVRGSRRSVSAHAVHLRGCPSPGRPIDLHVQSCLQHVRALAPGILAGDGFVQRIAVKIEGLTSISRVKLDIHLKALQRLPDETSDQVAMSTQDHLQTCVRRSGRGLGLDAVVAGGWMVGFGLLAWRYNLGIGRYRTFPMF